MKDYELTKYINNLIERDKIEEFYHTYKWQCLRKQVLELDHYECYDCNKKGILTRATLVHHVNEVKNRPDLAMSIWYKNKDGYQERNLVSLCFNCHEIRHDRFIKVKPSKKKYRNKEWW